jgi:prevent-host-death family protein
MSETHVSIGRVKRDLSELVNRVAYGGERIVLTSRGRPKAALVSIEDYERLEHERVRQARQARLAHWEAWLQDARRLSADILQRRQGEPLDVDALWEEARSDLEARDARSSGR